jgi:hypothetical protein
MVGHPGPLEDDPATDHGGARAGHQGADGQNEGADQDQGEEELRERDSRRGSNAHDDKIVFTQDQR